MGVNHSTKGTETVNAINNLALITGNIGRPGAAPFSITGQCNAMGTREVGLHLEPARLSEVRRRVGSRRAGGASGTCRSNAFPRRAGWPIPDIIEAALSRKIRALWIIGTNPIVSFPNLGVLKQALGDLEFLVVQDGFHPTPTSELAHLVLPAAIWGEKEGTYTNSERRVSKVNRGRARHRVRRARTSTSFSTWPAELGVQGRALPGLADARRRVQRVAPGVGGTALRLLGHDLRRDSRRTADCSGRVRPDTLEPAGTRRLYTDGRFQTADGKARLLPVRWEPFPEQPTTDFPLVLNTGRTVEHWHTRTKTGQVPILERLSPRRGSR